MSRREDTVSQSIEAAAYLERLFADYPTFDDVPDLADVMWDERDAAPDDPEDER